ncbi:MAG: GldM family protein, partial [Bacteroidota bacterium]
SKAKFRPILPAVEAIQAEVSNFNSYVSQLRSNLIDESGNQNGEEDEGDYVVKKGLRSVRGKKNKDVTTRILVYGEDGVAEGENGAGDELKERIIETRANIIKIYEDLLNTHGKDFDLNDNDIKSSIESVANNMPFSVDDETWRENNKKVSWADYKFGHMPVAAVLPLMSQIQSDLKVSEANIVNDLRQKAGGKVVEFDQFFPVFNADKSYVIGGERINAKVSVGSYSSSLDPGNIDLRVNGQRLNINSDGTADFSITGSGTGQKTLTTSVAVTNPLTGEVKTGEGKFTYEVGQRSVSVSADKMNVFYIGVDNPVSVAAAGVPSSQVRVSVTGAASKKSGNNKNLIVTGSRQGEATVSVTANNQSLGSFDFRVKRIPDPIPLVGTSRGGKVRSNEFKAQAGLYAKLENFDFEAKCRIQGYTLVYAPRGGDAIQSVNPNGPFSETSRRLVQRARPGDRYFIDNIKARCPGDQAGRPIGQMVFNIQ